MTSAPPSAFDVWVAGFGVIGFVLTALGLVLAWRQARAAKNAATAVSAAINDTVRQVATADLLSTLAAIRAAASDIESAGDRESRDVAVFVLRKLGDTLAQATSLAAHASTPVITPKMIRLLEEAREFTLDTKDALARNERSKVSVQTTKLMSKLTPALQEVVAFEATYKFEITHKADSE